MPGLSQDPDKRARQLAGIRAGQRKRALGVLGLTEDDLAQLGKATPTAPPPPAPTPAPQAETAPPAAAGPSSQVAGLPVLDVELPPASEPEPATDDPIVTAPQEADDDGPARDSGGGFWAGFTRGF